MRADGDERQSYGWPVPDGPIAGPFGERIGDLDVAFDGLPRPEVVTAVLSRYLRDAPEGALAIVESWTVAQRLQGLLAIARASECPPLQVRYSCSECGEQLELGLELSMFERREMVTEFTWSPQADCKVQVALPTGALQRQWSRGAVRDASALARTLVLALDGKTPSGDWQVPSEWLDGLAAELERRDPLTTLELAVTCPACTVRVDVPLDLEAELLTLLAACQERTLRDVHRLASAYHWTEERILGIPAWRRRYYLAQLAAGTPA
jgi:hypothetical protein